jgi:hypothetical protein
MRWAEQQQRIRRPAILGSVIQLGRCFDLLDTRFTRELGEFYSVWLAMLDLVGTHAPTNRGKARYLDRAVVEAYLLQAGAAGMEYDTVRAAFVEGDPIYPGSGLYRETHIQVAVRNPRSIVGVFRPL